MTTITATIAITESERGTTYAALVKAFKRRLLREILEYHAGNRTHAARELGLERTYLQRLIRDLDVEVDAGGARVLSPRICRGCGNVFAPRTALQRYGLEKCKRNAQRFQSRALPGATITHKEI